MVAAIVLAAPLALLNIALSSFLIGLGIYLGSLWLKYVDTEASGHASKNVFIFSNISTLAIIIFYSLPLGFKGIDDVQVAARSSLIAKVEDAIRQMEGVTEHANKTASGQQ